MSAYYKISFGSGFAWARVFVMKTEEPTTDYGALTDALIDYLVEQKDASILERHEWKWLEEGNDEIEASYGIIYYSDEYVMGGNCGDVLIHYGMFDITEISESEALESDAMIVEVA